MTFFCTNENSSLSHSLTKPDWSEREPPSQPKDELLEHLLTEFPYKVFKYHEHETLLDNKNEEELTEEEIQEAVRMHEEIKKKNVEKIQPDANDGTYNSYGSKAYFNLKI